MAVLPDYVSGTITLANGSTTVTGTGTMFETAAFRPGDTLQIQNLTAIIASVDSNTQLTLIEPWTGADLIDAPYRARYLPDGARVTAQTTTLIELLGNGVLSNIAELPVEDRKMLIGNAAGQYETISEADIGIQDPHGSLGELAGLTLAANKILSTNGDGTLTQSDITTAALSLLALAGDPNKFPFFDTENSAALAELTALGRAFLALTGTNGNIPVMTGAGTVASRPIVGPVTHSGGIPTGAIVEASASLTQGYMRLAGGVQICWRVTGSIPSGQENLGYIVGGSQYDLGAFAAAFVAQPAVIVGGTGSAGGGWIAQNLFGNSATWGSFSPRSHVSIGPSVQFYGLAIGRYF